MRNSRQTADITVLKGRGLRFDSRRSCILFRILHDDLPAVRPGDRTKR